jgi:hypothetical protein
LFCPAWFFKVLALSRGLGGRFIYGLSAQVLVTGLRRVECLAPPGVNPDVHRIACVSFAMLPMLFKGIFE